MKNSLRYFLLTFFIILLSIPGYWVLREKPTTQVSIVEGRVLGLPENSYPTLKIALEYIRQGNPQRAISLVWDLYTSGSLQKKFDGAATDQFPFRLTLIKFSKAIDRQIIELSYKLPGDDVIPADMTSDIYIMKNQNALIVPPGIYNEEIIDKINGRIKNYQEIANNHPKINFFIYYLETLPFSRYHPLNKFFLDADNGQAFIYFSNDLTDRINLGKLPLNSINEHMRHYYRTDHHWNTFGILDAYSGIINLIAPTKEAFPDQIEVTRLINFPGISFLGSYARKTLYPIVGDKFIGYETEFPDCIVKDQNVIGDYDFRDEYNNGVYPTTPYLDHYGIYFGSQESLLEYICDTESNNDILIIGDSYARPLVALIATHYNHTYYIDLRQNPDFSFSGFVKDHPIDDFLVVGDYEIVFLDTDQWMIKP